MPGINRRAAALIGALAVLALIIFQRWLRRDLGDLSVIETWWGVIAGIVLVGLAILVFVSRRPN